MRFLKRPDPDAKGPLLRIEDASFSAGPARALRRVNLEIERAEFHAVVGDHGAGKTSLANIVAGLARPLSGRIIFRGKSYSQLTLREARKLGIELVCQETHLIGCLTVTENLLIPDLVRYAPSFFRRKDRRKEVRNALSAYAFDFGPDDLVQELPPPDRLMLYILRSAIRNPALLVLDAVLEQLSAKDLDRMLRLLADLKENGTSILCLAHGLDEILTLADKVTILRNGRTILTEAVENVDKVNLIKLCYCQLSESAGGQDQQEFYQLLRYNEAILQKLPINLIVTDNENRLKMVNDNGRTYFNLGSRDYRSLFVDDLFSCEDGKALALIKDAFEAKREAVFFAVPLVIGGRRTTADIKALPIRDGAFFIGNILIVEDISKQESLRQQLTMSEKLASVGILAAGVAHEINNPLEIIYNHLNYLKFNLERGQINETIGFIEEELEDIKQIVSNLIAFSDRSRVAVEEFDLGDLIRSIKNLLKFNARRRNIAITFTPSETPVLVEARKNEIKQVILNLFKNSFEAAGDSGQIRIAVDAVAYAGVPLARIRFQDDGCGIRDENPDNVFLPFYSSKLGKEANLGLGLSVSYGIISKYNGEISVRNLEEAGCEFTILLPAAPGTGLPSGRSVPGTGLSPGQSVPGTGLSPGRSEARTDRQASQDEDEHA